MWTSLTLCVLFVHSHLATAHTPIHDQHGFTCNGLSTPDASQLHFSQTSDWTESKSLRHYIDIWDVGQMFKGQALKSILIQFSHAICRLWASLLALIIPPVQTGCENTPLCHHYTLRDQQLNPCSEVQPHLKSLLILHIPDSNCWDKDVSYCLSFSYI